MTFDITRRSFLYGFAATGFHAFAENPLAGTERPAPKLRIGLAADIHINQWRATTDRFKALLKYFDSAKVDGVLVAGDLADSGVVGELRKVGDMWRAQFPGGKRSDGAPIVNLMHYGDHDTGGYLCERSGFLKRHGLTGKTKEEIAAFKDANLLIRHREKDWEDAFGEKYTPVKVVNVKGYDFVLVHFDPRGGSTGCTKAAREFLASYKPDQKKPFFYSQHRIPLGLTKYRSKKGGICDNGDAAPALAKFKNAIALCGHGHRSFMDERSFFNEGGRVCLEIPATKFPLVAPPPGAEGKSHEDKAHPHQCVVMNVYDGFVEFERIDFMTGRALAGPWRNA